MNRGIFEGALGRYSVLGHSRVTADSVTSGGVELPDLPNDNRVRRTVLRFRGDTSFTLDATDPAGDAMYALADEIVVIDSSPADVRLRGDSDVEIIYFGT